MQGDGFDYDTKGVARACEVFSAISDEYERDPVIHPGTQELCKRFSGCIIYGQSATELGDSEILLKQTFDKHWDQIDRQRKAGYTPRSLDVALVFVCLQTLERLRDLRWKAALNSGWAEEEKSSIGKGMLGEGLGSNPWRFR